MAITVYSPHSGHPVKVRDQDLGRAIRDEAGRIFYVVERSDGTGYYGSLTRHGSDKDEQRYLDLEQRIASGQFTPATAEADAPGPSPKPHDATGRQRIAPLRLLGLIVVLLALIVAGLALVDWWLQWGYLFNGGSAPAPTPNQPDQPATPTTAPQAAIHPQLTPVPQRHLLPLLLTQARPTDRPNNRPATQPTAAAPGFTTTTDGIRYRTQTHGDGPKATAGNFVVIAYQLRGPEGRMRRQVSKDNPVGFVLWSGMAMRPLDIAVAGMKPGGRRTLRVPAGQVPATQPTTAAPQPPQPVANAVPLQGWVELLDVRSGLETTILNPATGSTAEPGDLVTLQYTGHILPDSGAPRRFADSQAQGQSLTFRIGDGEVIPGLELGVIGMARGEKRRLRIPPYLAYGQRGVDGLIPPGASLRFDLTLTRIGRPSDPSTQPADDTSIRPATKPAPP